MEWSLLFQQLGVALSPQQIEQLLKLSHLVLRYNKKHNLISKGDEPLIVERHLQDSLAPLRFIGTAEGPHIDIGSGTGFPLLPLAIAQPEREFVGVEPRSRRILQMNHLAGELGLQNITLIAARAEELSAKQLPYSLYNSATARAVGELSEDLERIDPFLDSGGRFVTFKTAPPTQQIPRYRAEWWRYQLHPDLKSYYAISMEKQL